MTRAQSAAALRRIAGRIEADPAIPPLSPHWPLVFPAGTRSPAELEAIARSLGVDAGAETLADEEGLPWLRVRGHAGGVLVEVTADTGPVLLDVLAEEGVIARSYLTGVAL
jgi:hypothetical protein